MMSTDDAVPRKGVTRANQMRTTKTEAALFFIECLNDLSCLFKFMDVLQIDDVDEFKSHRVVDAFIKLPHSPTIFNGAFNSYRAKLVLKSLGVNINPRHLKKFSQSDAVKGASQSRKRCQVVVQQVEDHKVQYREVLDLFVDCFVDRLKAQWQREDALLKPQSDVDALVVKKSLSEAFDELLLAQSSLPSKVDVLIDQTPVSRIEQIDSIVSTSIPTSSSAPPPNNKVDTSVSDASALQSKSASPSVQPVAGSMAGKDKPEVLDVKVGKMADEPLLKEETIFDKAIKARNNPVLATMFDISSWSDDDDEASPTSPVSTNQMANQSTQSHVANSTPASTSIKPMPDTKVNSATASETASVKEEDIFDKIDKAIKLNPKLEALFDISNWRDEDNKTSQSTSSVSTNQMANQPTQSHVANSTPASTSIKPMPDTKVNSATASEAASVKEEDIFDKALKARDNPVLAAMFDTSSWRD
ncbi:hypothetical protein AFK20_12660 [Enhydrobacter aerosaccus]|uniref:Uncharacterized protein n=1 Tax=Enhydrobacter aerosaccus TaxID=225324 RepID=A0ABR5IIV0_9HYPH|nr:hypothetical protein [Enhydrobacter aerosaccus]KND16959.1 hypothetical protein AFK20_12660 [Enhydrobacter aerosaccus]